jgi:hypothetical protein
MSYLIKSTKHPGLSVTAETEEGALKWIAQPKGYLADFSIWKFVGTNRSLRHHYTCIRREVD